MAGINRIGAGFVGVVGLAALVGWYSGTEWLTTDFPRHISMAPNTALSLIALAAAVTMLDRKRWAVPLGALAVGVAGATLLEHALDASFGIDNVPPGIEPADMDLTRMAPATAVALALLGGAVIAAAFGRSSLVRGLALVAFGVGYVAMLGHLYDVGSLYSTGGFRSLALSTATCIAILSVALLLSDGEAGLVGLLRDSGGTGHLMRSMVPFLLVGPPALGALWLWAQGAGRFDTSFGVAIVAMGVTVSGGALTWRAAVQLRLIDRQRAAAAAALAESNRTLESTVAERTQDLQAVTQRLKTLIRLAPAGIVELDALGGLVSTNEQWRVLSGLDQQDSLGEGWAAAVHCDDVERVRAEWGSAVAAGRAYETTLRLVTPARRVNWVHANTTPVHGRDMLVTGHLAAIMDVTALREAQDRALEAVARFQAAFASSPLGMALVSLEGEVLEANRRLAQLTGRSTGALQGEKAENLFEPPELPDEEPWLDELMDGTIASHRMERQLHLGEGAPIWVEVSITVVRDGVQMRGLLYELADVTARRLAENRAEHLAMHDPLTDLPNRLLLLDRLGQALVQAVRHGTGVGVLLIDLDRFKVVNDTLGHHAGDTVLTEVAIRLKSAARETDTVARLAGDEFAVLFPEVGNTRDVLAIADDLRAAIAAPISCGDQVTEISVSIGVAFGVGHDDPEALLRDAYQAMYQAKDRGRARHAVLIHDLRERIQRRLDTELGLRAAVGRNEIENWYQSIVDLQEPAVVASEAVARWRRPDIGIVMPETFMNIAEQTGLIKDIGARVLTQACMAAAAIPDGPAVSVNVSAAQFVRHDFGAVVDRALGLSKLPPDRLWLELTEGNIVEAIDSAARMFQSLRERGVRMAIDDFGSGFSSLRHLRSFNVDMLKIDATFIHDVERSDHDRAIVEGVLRLADSLHLDVVADGIETPGQRNLLRDLGCHFGQGCLLARPAPIAVSVASLDRRLPPQRRGQADTW